MSYSLRYVSIGNLDHMMGGKIVTATVRPPIPGVTYFQSTRQKSLRKCIRHISTTTPVNASYSEKWPGTLGTHSVNKEQGCRMFQYVVYVAIILV
jgi:hypothetical protein